MEGPSARPCARAAPAHWGWGAAPLHPPVRTRARRPPDPTGWQIVPGLAMLCSHAAILTPSPIRSPSLSSTTSPRWMPGRDSIRSSGATSHCARPSPFGFQWRSSLRRNYSDRAQPAAAPIAALAGISRTTVQNALMAAKAQGLIFARERLALIVPLHAGHNGLRSISAHVGNDYRRVRIGSPIPVTRRSPRTSFLSDFSKAEASWVEAVCRVVADAPPLLVAGRDASFQNKTHLAIEAAGLPPPVLTLIRREGVAIRGRITVPGRGSARSCGGPRQGSAGSSDCAPGP
jgi:Peptidyl-tRNA hydrolase